MVHRKTQRKFEKSYLEKHMPIASAVMDIELVELVKVLPSPDGKPRLSIA
jgi:hypothetical protein